MVNRPVTPRRSAPCSADSNPPEPLVAIPEFAGRNLPLQVSKLRRLIADRRVSAVVGMQPRDRLPAMIAGRSMRCATLIHAGQPPVFQGSRRAQFVKRHIYAAIVRRTVDLVVCSSSVVEQRNHSELRIRKDRTVVLWNGIDRRPFAAAAAAGSPRAPSAALQFLTVGRIAPEKGHDVCLAALATLVDHPTTWHLDIAGDEIPGRDIGNYREQLATLVAAPGMAERVTFLGWRTDINQRLAAADVYLHPALFEGWPLAVVEALASGTPTILTDCSGIPPEWIDGIHGWIVPAGDRQAFAAAVLRVLEMQPEERSAVGQAGSAYAEKWFDIDRVGQRFVELVETSVRARRPGGHP